MGTWSKGTLVGERHRVDVILPAPVVHEAPKVVGPHWQVVRWSPVAARWTATAVLSTLLGLTSPLGLDAPRTAAVYTLVRLFPWWR
ncbi:hypothetical protein [Actinomadura montaniterrae]|uniref:Uncharacterized protein n=1 Tax=Actinomadura montaniterrae TaxID=1803903 RepID=A0A6L3W1V0_9ACTN|nr:hypothetical protein [Actinomadura montaniterrae]KAB2388831.1 hypothetical protein F9B16_02640 [Actinomadura montaniterrae]